MISERSCDSEVIEVFGIKRINDYFKYIKIKNQFKL